MATKLVKIDDLDQKTEGAEEVLFGLAGEFWIIDLAMANQKKLRDALAPFIKAATPVTAKEAARWTPAVPINLTVADDPATVRSWALSQGYQIGEKGRVPENIRQAYLAAHAAAERDASA